MNASDEMLTIGETKEELALADQSATLASLVDWTRKPIWKEVDSDQYAKGADEGPHNRPWPIIIIVNQKTERFAEISFHRAILSVFKP